MLSWNINKEYQQTILDLNKEEKNVKIKTNGIILEYVKGELFEIRSRTQRTPYGKGKILGYGFFSGQCPGEVPSIITQEPEVGLQLLFQAEGTPGKTPTFISGEITRVIEA